MQIVIDSPSNQFELKEFHNVVLKNGAVPLDVLEEIIESYVSETLF